MHLEKILALKEKIIDNLSKVILGKPEVLELFIMGLICNGHILIEDIPGTGKTILAKSLAATIDSEFKRIQFTPDMLPSDITGVTYYDQEKQKLIFKKGPVFANIVLADEINRATPKTQSALLEGMEERQITVDGITHPLPDVFLVIATQNPIEYAGTNKLPEAQLDRFLIKITIGYPQENIEKQIIADQNYSHPINALNKAISLNDVGFLQEEIKKVHVSENVMNYIIQIIDKTRHNENIVLGASPRGSLALYRLGQCRAAFKNRDYVTPDDIKYVCVPVLAHRLILNPSFRLQTKELSEFIKELVFQVEIPGN